MTDPPADETAKLLTARDAFFQTVSRGYSFTSFRSCNLTSPDEETFIQAIAECQRPIGEIIATLSSVSDCTEPWSLTTFGLRRAVTAVRTDNVALYRLGLLPFLAGLSDIDWRDKIVRLAAIEDCGQRLRLNAREELHQAMSSYDHPPLQERLETYFSRSDAMRDVRGMGLYPFGEQEDFWYQ